MISRNFIAKTRRMKGFIISFQWVNEEPAMCIMREFLGTKSAYVICLSAAYKYADLTFLVPQAAKMAAHFGMHGERQAALNLCDIVLECLEDVVKMKPEPKDAEVERTGPVLKPEWDGRNNTIVLH